MRDAVKIADSDVVRWSRQCGIKNQNFSSPPQNWLINSVFIVVFRLLYEHIHFTYFYYYLLNRRRSAASFQFVVISLNDRLGTKWNEN